MDIAGAKALKQRLGSNGVDEAPAPADSAADVPADAPPVYHWTGVSKRPATAPAAAADDDPQASNVSLIRRLGLSSR